MDSATLLLVGTLLVGVVGVVVFFASQPAAPKKRSASISSICMKPRP